MRTFILAACILAFAGGAHAADDTATCVARHAELTVKVRDYTGDAQLKQLMEADLKRAMKELAEGDADECIEALDHTVKLLAGNV